MLESKIRDLIADNIGVVEDGLTLLSTEKYIPKGVGTKSFIDILAKDKDNNWVIIEVKRSNSTSREAIHEIFKYAEAIKTHFSARDDELRAIIISTEWDELLIPFSKFVADTSLEVRGLKLSIQSETNKISCETVDPVKLNNGRMLAPWHELNFYKDQNSLDRGLREFKKVYESRNIMEYVLVALKAPLGLFEAQMEVTRRNLVSIHMQSNGIVDNDSIEDLLRRIDRTDFALYCAHQLLTVEECTNILKSDEYFNLKDFDDMEDEEKLLSLHEECFALEPRAHCDRYEIGNAAKFSSKLIENEGWSILKIYRGGALSRNPLLTDREIIAELGGETGSSGQRFKRKVKTSNKAQMESARSAIRLCLSNNPAWQQNIMHHLDEIALLHEDAEAEISIYNPSSCIFTLYFAATHDKGILFAPTYTIIIKNKSIERMYCGHLVGGSSLTSFNEILEKFYGGDIFGLLLTASGNYYESRDSEILEEIGLIYSSFRCDKVRGNNKFFELRNGRWRGLEEFSPFKSFIEFINNNESFMYSLVRKISFRFTGGLVNGDSCNSYLNSAADEQLGRKNNIFYHDAPANCDVCDISFDGEKYMIDGKTKNRFWACMCTDCFTDENVVLGWGSGQLYRQVSPQKWLQVSGFRPEDDKSDLDADAE